MPPAKHNPIDKYGEKYEALHQSIVCNYFDNLLKTSGVDEAENQNAITKIEATEKNIVKLNSSVKWEKFVKAFIIALAAVFFAIGSLYAFIFALTEAKITLLIPVETFIFGALLIWLIIKKITPEIKVLKLNIMRMENLRDEQIDSAKSQVEPLLNLFSGQIPVKLAGKTCPDIKFDEAFDIRRYDCLHRKYGLAEKSDFHSSAVYVRSGEINEIPFCIFKTLNQKWETKTNKDSKTIRFYDYEFDKEGVEQEFERREEVNGSVIEAFPAYFYKSFLVYGSGKDSKPVLITEQIDENLDITGDTNNYRHYGVAEIRKKFIDYNNLYFKTIYHLLAPLLDAPHEQQDFVYLDAYKSNLCCYEHEYRVNQMDKSLFAPPFSATTNILKTRHYASDKENDKILVTAYGFKKIPRTVNVPVLADDNQYHEVPVDSCDYSLVSKETDITIKVRQ
ncbi:MAG: hypothetical protein LBR64_10930 [Dysgonamonadaceae bacterium]|jgi:hypothetical protein|nr:hypothetical protein [Dysgonamonadaceae bacterium]